MKKLKSIIMTLLCFVIAAICFACGGSGNNPGPEKPGEQETPKDPEIKVTLDKTAIDFVSDIDGVTEETLTATVKIDGEVKSDAKVVFASSDANVVMVNDQGVVSMIGGGYAEVTATYEGVTAKASVTVHHEITADQVNTFGKGYVNTFGRNVYGDGNVELHHTASGFEVNFVGTELTADISLAGILPNWSRARVFVDGDLEGNFVTLTSSADFKIVSGLTEGYHTVRFLKSSELIHNQITVSNLRADKFYTPNRLPDLKIEFLGDSITAGFGVLGVNGTDRNADNSDATSAWAYKAVQKIGCDFSILAESGIAVKVALNPADHNMTYLYPLLTPYPQDTPYDFDDGVTVTVINLGTNDATYIDQADKTYATRFIDDYTAFLQYIRSVRPNAYIVCTYGFMGKNSTLDKAINKAVKNMNDPKVSYWRSPLVNRGGCATHPDAQSAIENAERFAAHLQSVGII